MGWVTSRLIFCFVSLHSFELIHAELWSSPRHFKVPSDSQGIAEPRARSSNHQEPGRHPVKPIRTALSDEAHTSGASVRQRPVLDQTGRFDLRERLRENNSSECSKCDSLGSSRGTGRPYSGDSRTTTLEPSPPCETSDLSTSKREKRPTIHQPHSIRRYLVEGEQEAARKCKGMTAFMKEWETKWDNLTGRGN